MTAKREWEQRLAAWLAGGVDLESGAELEVTDHDGKVVFLAPLARQYRVADDALWIRPIVGGYIPAGEPGLPPYAFHLNEARARALAPLKSVEAVGEEIIIRTGAGQLARIRPAGSETMRALVRWDTFVYTVLSAEDEADLEAVVGDSDWGEWA